ncbi:MAG: cadmium-translocating P-type ATPase [Sphingobacteriales bacterium]|nr:MAG: cadmium-translocating P-type ATPase [Sphingobacteriales bacterium]
MNLVSEIKRVGIEGMDCNNCALGIQKFLEKKGLQQVSVSFSNAEASFELNENITYEEVVSGIEKLGYHVVSSGFETEEQEPEQKGWTKLEWKLLICSILTVPLLLSMFLPIPILHNTVVQLLLCIPVFIIGADHFGSSAFKSLRTGVPNMDVLIIVGTTAAFIYSLIGLTFGLGHQFMFWETAATIITLVLTGNVIEHRSVRKTGSAIRELSKLQPLFAKRIKIDSQTGEEMIEEVNSNNIIVGQVFLVNTGDRIPTDGMVVWGSGGANEAMMTGESMLSEKGEGSSLIGGSVLETGSIKMKATKVGKETALAQIIELVRRAQANQPPIHKLADKISAIFVPLVLLIALATFLFAFYYFQIGFKQAILNSIAVLVISCPCAMGLATPTALTVGLGRAAKNGILIKSGIVLETLSKAKTVVFDKTGTLTTGSFIVKNIQSNIDIQEFISILLGLERHSTHPLAKAISEALEKESKPMLMKEVKEIKGTGIMGKDEQGNVYMAGSFNIADEFTDDNTHNIYVLKNGQLIGWVDLADELRPEAKEAVNGLIKNGFQTLMISGDNRQKTEDVAQAVGIPTYYANKLPNEKLDMIENLTKEGIIVMVGDGINDSPALAKASVGIALSNASQVAIDSADVVLLNNNLKSLNTAIALCKHTLLTVKQNLFWAFFYNVLAIPLAAAGLLNPMIAAFTMAFSDVIVIGNSLRLRTKKIEE